MKNLKFYIFYAVLGLVVISCQKEQDTNPHSGLGFSAVPQSEFEESAFTRGTPVSSAGRIPSMGVFGYYTGDGVTNNWAAKGSTATPNFMNNETITNATFASGTATWSYANPVYWPYEPSANVSFFAYSPYATGLLGNGIEIVTTTGIPVLKYTVPSDCATQPDLMVAGLRNDLNKNNGANVNFAMNHALTSIKFKATGQGETITNIVVTGVKTSGKLTTAVNGDFSWSDLEGSGSFTPKYSQPALSPTATMLTDADGYLMMIPQTLDANAKLTITVNQGGSSKIVVFSLSGTWVAGETVSYSVIVKPDVVEFAMSNIVFDGRNYTFAENVAALATRGINANAQGLKFKFGSLVGISGASSDFSAATHIPLTTLPGYSDNAGLSTINWYDVPYFTEATTVTSGENQNEFEATYTTTGSFGYDASTGKGDICRYISDQGWVAGQWRMPTANEVRAYYSSGAIALSNPGFYGLRFGGYQSSSTSGHDGRDIIQSGYYFGPWVLTQASTTLTNHVIVSLPAAGYRRSSDAASADVGTSGFYWSSSTVGNTSGSKLGFAETFADENNIDRDYAFSVRCVRQ